MCQMFAGQDQERYESVTRSLRLNGQSTSIRLERSFWHIVDQIAAEEQLSTPAFISKLHAEVLEIHGEALAKGNRAGRGKNIIIINVI